MRRHPALPSLEIGGGGGGSILLSPLPVSPTHTHKKGQSCWGLCRGRLNLCGVWTSFVCLSSTLGGVGGGGAGFVAIVWGARSAQKGPLGCRLHRLFSVGQI